MMVHISKDLSKLSFAEFKRWLSGRRFSSLDAEKLYKSIGGTIPVKKVSKKDSE